MVHVSTYRGNIPFRTKSKKDFLHLKTLTTENYVFFVDEVGGLEWLSGNYRIHCLYGLRGSHSTHALEMAFFMVFRGLLDDVNNLFI